MKPPLPPADALTVLRAKYPVGLVCTVCAALLATRRESYARSNLTDAARLAYVCAECRLDIAERERIAAVRAEAGRRNLVLARAAKASRADVRADVQDGTESTPSQSQEVAQLQYRLMSRRSRGGRPRKHADRRAASRAATRAYRQRQRRAA